MREAPRRPLLLRSAQLQGLEIFPPLTPFREGERTAMSSPLALRITSLFASSFFQISSRVRVRSAEVTNWGASKAALVGLG